ncbi:MAG: hypothetical protein JRJ19_11495 [Deltaproteobacteria bacterium]|nr:hypothetical protein [Deltaproteobacteria bacterium]
MTQRELKKKGLEIMKLPAEQASAILDGRPLEERLEILMSLPAGRQRLDLILMSAKPAELVQAMPPEDFILTVKAIGEVDSLALFEMSTDQQTTYMSDLETWVQNGLDLGRLAFINELLFQCDDKRLLRWIRSLDFEVLVLTFERTVLPVEKEARDTLPERLANRIFTPDGYHYLLARLGTDIDLVKKFINFIYANDQPMFMAIMGNLGTLPLAEIEELALKWRNGRLADRGWPDLDEANEVYQPHSAKDVDTSGQLPYGPDNPPRYPLERHYGGKLLSAGLMNLEDPSRVAGQLANLINRVIVADGMLPTEIESMELAATRVKGRIEIGLAVLGARDGNSAAGILSKIALLTIFQVAQTEILKRTKRACQLTDLSAADLIGMLESGLAEVLSALMARRQKVHQRGALVSREFNELADLSLVDGELDLIEASLTLANALGLTTDKLPVKFPAGWVPDTLEGLSLNTWLTTAFARERLKIENYHTPLPFEELGVLFESLPGEQPSTRELLLNWAKSYIDQDIPGLARLAQDLADMLYELRTKDPGALDPRFIEGLWLQTR